VRKISHSGSPTAETLTAFKTTMQGDPGQEASIGAGTTCQFQSYTDAPSAAAARFHLQILSSAWQTSRAPRPIPEYAMEPSNFSDLLVRCC
jgi:hypothetical protein